jgi:aldehyde:ferredoxin oxidoreductase
MQGFFHRILTIDVSRQHYEWEGIPEPRLKDTLGGKGLATQLLLERNPQGVDPLSPENNLIFALGPVTDTPIWGGCRYGIFSKSPLTGFFAESYSGGSVPQAMSRTGVDAFIIKGAADRPIWLEITESGVNFHQADALWGKETYAQKTLAECKEHKAAQAYKHSGTPMMVSLLNTAGGFPARYWSRGTFESFEQINAESMRKRLEPKPKACKTCFMACGKLSTVTRGRHQGLRVEGPEYETIYAFGGLCCIDQIEEIAYLNDLCDRLGLDTISAGNLVGLMMEGSHLGLIDEHYEYGNADQTAQLLQDMAYVRGSGRLLAQGIRPAAKELGLEDLAVHVNGMEPAGSDPRALKGMGLAYAVSDRGACHLRSTFYKAELSGQIDPEVISDKAAFFLEYEDRCTVFDTLILCRFYRDFYWDELGRIIDLTTGLDLDQKALKQLAARVTDLTRKFNIREGLTRVDDQLPDRLYTEPWKTDNVSPEMKSRPWSKSITDCEGGIQMGSQRDVCVSPASTRSSLAGALIPNTRMIRKPSFSGPRKISPDSGNITKWSHWIPTFKRSCMLFWPRPRGNLWAEQAEVGRRRSDFGGRRSTFLRARLTFDLTFQKRCGEKT